jgi:hypothetical protein
MMGDLRDFNKNPHKNNDNSESNNNNTDVNTVHVEDSHNENTEMKCTVLNLGLDKQPPETSETC